MAYYHSAPLSLAPGSIIQPGNWGRILNCYRCVLHQTEQNAWMLAREMIFETVRASKYPNLPSRLSCGFVFESLDDANKYLGEFTPWNSLYEVELTDPSALVHHAGFNLVKFPQANIEFLPAVVNCAERYWQGRDIEIPEILTKSSLRIKALVSSGPGGYQP